MAQFSSLGNSFSPGKTTNDFLFIYTGVSLIVTCITTEMKENCIHVCFACEEAFADFGLEKHLDSISHLVNTLVSFCFSLCVFSTSIYTVSCMRRNLSQCVTIVAIKKKEKCAWDKNTLDWHNWTASLSSCGFNLRETCRRPNVLIENLY